MKVFLKTHRELSKAMDRVVYNLVRYSPTGTTIVDDPIDADLVVLHVIGFPETEESVKRLLSLGKKYAIVQYCLRTTQNPNTLDWIPIWAGAELVWSYYDLEELCREDGTSFPEDTIFYYAPLGVDNNIFNPGLVLAKYPYKIFTSGTVARSETTDIVNSVCKSLNKKQIHLGDLTDKSEEYYEDVVEYHKNISDNKLAQLYRQTEYVSGLRRIEGFELPAAEGLMCGCVPILYDKPHYRYWYDDLGAIFIKEGTDEEIFEQLSSVLTTDSSQYRKINFKLATSRFNWYNIINKFWESLPKIETKKTQLVEVIQKPNRRLLWVGDAVAATGFAKATHKILDVLKNTWDIHVLGLNYYGDPHDYPYKIYPAKNGGDMFGVRRLPWAIEKVRPEFVVIQNDPWNFPQYLKVAGSTPVVGIVAVDGLNCRGEELNGLQHAIFWTEFGATEAAKGGYRGSSSVIPLGVDTELYRPIERETARKAMGVYDYIKDAFVVGNVNRNQPRKRLDLTIQYFCEWIKTRKIEDAYLYLHIAPTGDQGYDAKQLMKYYAVPRRLILATPEILYGVKETMMPYVYNCFDVQISTTQGEGFGLTTLEGMACGVPQIVPDWSALGDLFKEAAELVPCTTTIATPNDINVIGGVADKELFIYTLDKMYSNHLARVQSTERCLELARNPKFDWKNIGNQYFETLDGLFSQKAYISA